MMDVYTSDLSDLFMQSLLAIRTNAGLLHIIITRRPFRVREKILMVPDFAAGVKVLRHEHDGFMFQTQKL